MPAEQTLETVRDALRRWLSPLVAWTALIPDVSLIPRRRQAAIAAGASVILHLLLLLCFGIVAMILPEKKEIAPPVPPKPLQVQLVPMPDKADPDPLVQKRREVMALKGLDPSAEPPVNADIESDINSKAGSEQPATGLLPLPGQEGRNLPGYEFADQQVRIGVTPDPQPETLRPPDPKEKTPTPQPPAVQPLYKPQPVTPEELAKVAKADPAEKIPEPATPLKATPPPLKITDKPKETDVAMLVATPRPMPIATPAPVPTFAANLPTPRPSITSRYRANMVKTEVQSAITNRGKPGVNAINTPMGRYNRRLGQQIESLWTLKRQGALNELGTVRISVRLREDGTVQGAKVVDDGGSPHHTEICLQVIRDMQPEPMPKEAEPMLEDGTMEITFSFTLF